MVSVDTNLHHMKEKLKRKKKQMNKTSLETCKIKKKAEGAGLASVGARTVKSRDCENHRIIH